MANIFISFFDATQDPLGPGAMTCHYESMVKGFVAAGNNVLYYQHAHWNKDFGIVPSWFKRSLANFNPDIAILFDNRCFDISNVVDCPILIWEADSYLYFSNKEDIAAKPNRYHYIVGQTDVIDIVKKHFNVTKDVIFYIPPITAIKAEELPQDHNISFIGTRFDSPNIATRFMADNPSEAEIGQFRAMLEYVESDPFISNQALFEKFNVTSELLRRNFNVMDAIALLSVRDRLQVLSVCSDLGLAIYGAKDWIEGLLHEPGIVLSYKRKRVYSLKDNQDIYNKSKISININHAQAKTGFSWRVFDIMASNSCLVTQPKKDFLSLVKSINIPTYTNRYEAYEVCKKLLNDESLRHEIVRSCQALVDKSHRFVNLISTLEQILGINLRSRRQGILTRLTHKMAHDPATKHLSHGNIGPVQEGSINESTDLTPAQRSAKPYSPVHQLTYIKSRVRLKTRTKLLYLSILLFMNQVPYLNKILMSRDEIIDKIDEAIQKDKVE